MWSEMTYNVLRKPTYAARNEISINEEEINKLGLITYIFVTVVYGANSVPCLVTPSKSLGEGCVQLSKRSMELLGMPIDEDGAGNTGEHIGTVSIMKPKFESIKRAIPRVDEIGSGVVKACPKLIERYSSNVEILNPQKGFRINLKLEPKEKAKENSVYLDRYTMLLLGLNPDKPDEKLNLYITADQNEQPGQPHIGAPKQNASIQALKRFIGTMVPEFLGKAFIGHRELTLRIGYLYPFDEHCSLARIHPNTRKLLGIEETDEIKVTYKGQQVKLPVLDYDPQHFDQVFDIQNPFIDGHLLIGIPAASRNSLQVPNIGTTVQVRRSKHSLFLKHLNRLILPTLALWFTILQITKDIAIIAITTSLMVPVIIFTALSEERGKISGKGSQPKWTFSRKKKPKTSSINPISERHHM